jgi:FixJ family two-component response regulator
MTADIDGSRRRQLPEPSGTPTVFVVDDDVSVRESLAGLLSYVGWHVETFASAEEFLGRPATLTPSCLVLDVSLPDLNGLDLQERMAIDCVDIPIIFITGHRNIPMTVRAMRAGAVDFLVKPFSQELLLAAITGALERSIRSIVQAAALQELRVRYASLSVREREVMALVTSGKLNKYVGRDLGISEITVKAHRGRVMYKMAAESLADLVRIATSLRC